MRHRILILVGALCATTPLPAQTSADSASIVLHAAQLLAREGHNEAARRLFQLIRARYAATPAARAADSLLAALSRTAPASAGSTGRTGFVLFHTLYGGFLGAAIPAAFGAEGTEPYGAGLLIGAPLGYFGSRAFARARITRPGQAGIASFATIWGTWHGLAVQQMLDLGDRELCDVSFGCYSDESDTAPWAAMVIGGLAGLGTGLALASREIPAGTSTLVTHSAFWGSWFGLSLGAAFGVEGDGLFGTALIGGNAALLAAIPAAKAWRPSSSRVRITTAAGVAGGVAGFGIDLLANLDDERVVFAIPAATSAVGLLVGALASHDQRDSDESDVSAALLTWREQPRFNIPLPIPTAVPGGPRGPRWRPGLKLVLLDATF